MQTNGKFVPMKILLLFFLAGSLFAMQQNIIQGKVIDVQTKEPIAYATVQIGDKVGVITNQEGNFTLEIKEEYQNQKILISHIGYEPLYMDWISWKNGQSVALQPANNVLQEVVLGPRLTIPQILEKFKTNSAKNHVFANKRIQYFQRTKGVVTPKDFELDLKKVTFANQKQLQQKLQEFIQSVKNKDIENYTEVMTEVYHSTRGLGTNHIKALKLVDPKGFNLDNFEEKFLELTFHKLESPYTYKIKTGIIRLDKDASFKDILKDSKAADTLKNTSGFYFLSYAVVSNKEFITNQDAYAYEFKGIQMVQGMPCYHIAFQPKKSKAKYVGEMMIHAEDFGMVYHQYQLAPDKKEFNINLKWLLGIKVQSIEVGREVLMSKASDGSYYPQWIKNKESNYAYINRNLNIIENHPKRKERKQLNLDFLIEMTTNEEEEIIATKVELHDPKEKISHPTYILYDTKNQYDANYWKGFQVLEATQRMKEFKVD